MIARVIVEVLVIAGALGVGAYGFVKARYSPEARHRRALRRSERWRIGELPEGVVGRVSGTARPCGPTLQAPLTGRECLCYLVIVSVDEGNRERDIVRVERGVPFVLEDGSGRALVDADGALLERRDGDTRRLDGARTRRQVEVLEAHGAWHYRDSTLTFREEIVGVGENICVAGAGVREPDPEGEVGEGYRAEPSSRLRIGSSKKFRILITDNFPDY